MAGLRREVGGSAYVAALWFLTLLFCLRIAGQFIQVLNPVPWLSSLPAWQGSTLPYGILLAFQLVILVAMIRIAARHASGGVKRRPVLGKGLLVAGTVYFFGMTGRLIIGLANWSDHPWFHKPIPAFFHMVLASYLLTLAAFHTDLLRKVTR